MQIDLTSQFHLGLVQVKSYEFNLFRKEKKPVKVYLIHFDQPYKHAKHYLGSAENLGVRMAQHRKGQGARLLDVLNENNIGYRIVRIWSNGGRDLERKLKASKNNTRLCPVCNPLLTIEKFIDPETLV